ncbi:MAG: hypothetical protein WBA39_03295 [Rivularia sp. (in: cyanobacteria)]
MDVSLPGRFEYSYLDFFLRTDEARIPINKLKGSVKKAIAGMLWIFTGTENLPVLQLPPI